VSASIPPRMCRMVLVRHGEAEGNRELRYLGDHEALLTERGLVQAEQVAVTLTRFDVVAIFSSPRARAQQTATAIARGAGIHVHLEPDLRELSYGEWEGLLHTEVMALHPDLLRRWETDAEVAPPGGESLRAMSARVVACADRLASAHGGQCIAMVSHVGPIKALVCHALGLGVDGARRMWLDTATVCVVDWPLTSDGAGVLRLFNSFGHLTEGVRWLA
jgi:ribonuclease H / adenosylcobalamin/alpha-ribazole phosphatase